MTGLDYFLYLAGGTAEFLAALFPVTFLIGLMSVAALVWAAASPTANRSAIVAACLVPAVVPVSLLVVGVAFVKPGRTAWPVGVSEPAPWFSGPVTGYAETGLTALCWSHLPLGIGLGWWASRCWPAAVAGTLWWGWVSFCAGGMATMSVTGNWL